MPNDSTDSESDGSNPVTLNYRGMGKAEAKEKAEEDSPRWFAYIAVGVTLVALGVAFLMMGGAAYYVFRVLHG